MKGDALDSRLRDDQKAFRASKEITQCLIASLSRDEDIVIDQCQKLSAMTSREGFDAKAELIGRHMGSLMNVWGQRTRARTEIMRLMDKIESTVKRPQAA